MAEFSAMLKSPITAVWLFLIAATLISWSLGTDHVLSDAQLAAVAVLAVAFIKVRFVGLFFMELRHAPLPLRIIFETWCLAVGTAVIVMFLVI